jgi:two-component system LytT family sensor kinase
MMSAPDHQPPRLRFLYALGPAVGLLRVTLVAIGSIVEGWTPDWYAIASHLVGMSLWAPAAPLAMAVARRWPVSRETWHRNVPRQIATGLAIIAGIWAAYLGLRLLAGSTGWWPSYEVNQLWRVALSGEIVLHAVLYCAIVGGTLAADYQSRYRLEELRAAELQGELVRAQLAALRYQLNPHFLFNTLNSVSALIQDDPRAADTMVMRLAQVLRTTLDDGLEQQTTLAQELEVTRAYLDIERVRYGDRLRVEEQVAPETLSAAVPSLLLQPLVENAVKHALRHRGSLQLTIRAVRRGGRLAIEVSDDGPGPGPTARRGVGLDNTRARLAALYGEDQMLSLTRRPGGGARCRVEVPWRLGRERQRDRALPQRSSGAVA